MAADKKPRHAPAKARAAEGDKPLYNVTFPAKLTKGKKRLFWCLIAKQRFAKKFFLLLFP